MKNTKVVLAGLSFLLMTYSAQAQVIMCKDAAGRTLTSDRPIPECTSAVREFGANGLTRVIPAPLTAEEKRQKKLDEEKQKVVAAAEKEQRRQDRAMLARYNNEFEINAARDRALAQEQEQLKRDKLVLADAEKQLADAKGELTVYKFKNGKPPQALTHKAETAEMTIQDTHKSLKDHEDQIAQINIKFDETLKRYRELTAPAESK
jgi:hypothetical protein